VIEGLARFHQPAHAAEWADPGIDADFDAVVCVSLAGLGAAEPARHATAAKLARRAAPKRRRAGSD
jgi:hypothetical protein